MAMKIGDRVTVYRKVNNGIWVDAMDETVGVSGVIHGKGIDYFRVVLDNGDAWNYPFSCLKFEKKKEEEEGEIKAGDIVYLTKDCASQGMTKGIRIQVVRVYYSNFVGSWKGQYYVFALRDVAKNPDDNKEGEEVEKVLAFPITSGCVVKVVKKEEPIPFDVGYKAPVTDVIEEDKIAFVSGYYIPFDNLVVIEEPK